MKNFTRVILVAVAMILVSALYRIIPGRPYGFAPQIAMALFCGAVIPNRKLSFLVPLGSMFVSDLLFELVYRLGWSGVQGFYQGQWVNYLLFGGLTCLGWAIRPKKIVPIALGSLAGPVLYFLASNFATWIGGGGYQRPKTWDGLLQCMNDGLPFFRGSLEATLLFGTLFFGSFAWIQTWKTPTLRSSRSGL